MQDLEYANYLKIRNTPFTLETYRLLTPEQVKLQMAAVKLLRRKHLSYEAISLLHKSALNFHEKTIIVEFRTKKVRLARIINYANTPLEDYIKVLESEIHSKISLFPRLRSKGKVDMPLPTYRTGELEQIAENSRNREETTKKIVIFIPLYGRIEVSRKAL